MKKASRSAATHRITEVTRRRIFDRLSVERVSWSGQLDEVVFLDRLYDLDDMQSTDRRFSTAREDIVQHCVTNHDWRTDWVFYDARFELGRGPDDVLLRFLAETRLFDTSNETCKRCSSSSTRRLRRMATNSWPSTSSVAIHCTRADSAPRSTMTAPHSASSSGHCSPTVRCFTSTSAVSVRTSTRIRLPPSLRQKSWSRASVKSS